MNAEQIARILDEHAQYARNQRCTCGWRPRFPQDRFGGESFQHRDHLAVALAEAFAAEKE